MGPNASERSLSQEDRLEHENIQKKASSAAKYQSVQSKSRQNGVDKPVWGDLFSDKERSMNNVNDVESVMNWECLKNNMRIKDIIQQINDCHGKAEDIKVNGLGYTGCQYFEIKKKEEEDNAPIEESSLPLPIRIQKTYAKELNKTKRKENLWFDKLEQELEKLDVEDTLLEYQRKSLPAKDAEVKQAYSPLSGAPD